MQGKGQAAAAAGAGTLSESPLSSSMFCTKYTSPYPVASGRISDPPNASLQTHGHSHVQPAMQNSDKGNTLQSAAAARHLPL